MIPAAVGNGGGGGWEGNAGVGEEEGAEPAVLPAVLLRGQVRRRFDDRRQPRRRRARLLHARLLPPLRRDGQWLRQEPDGFAQDDP